jgi:hypothetical protein
LDFGCAQEARLDDEELEDAAGFANAELEDDARFDDDEAIADAALELHFCSSSLEFWIASRARFMDSYASFLILTSACMASSFFCFWPASVPGARCGFEGYFVRILSPLVGNAAGI